MTETWLVPLPDGETGSSFVMGFGADAELLEPADLRKETAVGLARAVARCGDAEGKGLGPRRV